MSIEDLIRQVVRDELAKAKPQATPEHVTVDEYAKRWSISPSTVRAAIREQRLAVTRIGRAIRIDAAATISPPVRDATARARLRLMGGGRVR